MSIIRSKREDNFTIIDNKVFERGFLSYQARGLLCTLLSYPDNWKVNVDALINEVEGTDKESKESVIYNILRALRAAGYVQLIKHSNGETDYIIYDKPNLNFCKQEKLQSGLKPNLKNPDLEKPDLENCDVLIRTKTTTSTKKETSTNIAGTSEDVPALPIVADKKSKQPNPDNIATWEAYRQAYFNRYGVEPLRNAKVNSQVANLVKSVGAEAAPFLAAYYVQHNNSWFVQRRHEFGLLVAGYQQVYTDMMRNEQMTATKARKQDETQNLGQAANELIAKFQAEAQA